MSELCLVVEKFNMSHDDGNHSFVRFIVLEYVDKNDIDIINIFQSLSDNIDSCWDILYLEHPNLNAIYHNNEVIYANEITLKELAQCVFEF